MFSPIFPTRSVSKARMSFLPSLSRIHTWSRRQTSLIHFAIWPSTIFCMTGSGFFCWRASSRRMERSCSRTAAGISSCDTYWGLMAATCMATSRAKAWKSGLRDTKSVSQFTSTSTPMREPCM